MFLEKEKKEKEKRSRPARLHRDPPTVLIVLGEWAEF